MARIFASDSIARARSVENARVLDSVRSRPRLASSVSMRQHDSRRSAAFGQTCHRPIVAIHVPDEPPPQPVPLTLPRLVDSAETALRSGRKPAGSRGGELRPAPHLFPLSVR